ncbi:MAG: host attachment protein [Acidobacteriia bacterium]|nr:host attachment protein [Terriglobia bacterium]
MTREQIRELAEFQDEQSCALSFYFQPQTPRNKAHKEDAILIKDLVREAQRNLESKGKKDCARADLERIMQLSSELRSNGTHGRAVFACSAQNFWREYELPPQLPGTRLFVGRHFHLKPLAHMLGALPRLGVALVDRHRARLFELRLGEWTEWEDLFHPLPRRGRSDGFAGYDAGHAQRRVEDEALHHFKNVAEALKNALDKGVFEKWILGSQDIHRSQLEPQLHPYVSQALLGHFSADLVRVSKDEMRSQSERIVKEWQERRCRELVSQALNQARGNARGVTGLRRVLRSLELGEVQSLMIGENFLAHAVECSGCGHLDAHLVNYCPVCGKATHEVVDVGEAILPWVIRRDIEMFYVKGDPEFDKVGNIAALLRFRSEQNSNVRSISSASTNQAVSERPAYPGRLRRLASR